MQTGGGETNVFWNPLLRSGIDKCKKDKYVRAIKKQGRRRREDKQASAFPYIPTSRQVRRLHCGSKPTEPCLVTLHLEKESLQKA